jgi:hypothetical protein
VVKGLGAFEVETRLGRVIALGTVFSVKLLPGGGTDRDNPDRLAVAVLEGLVQVDFAGKSYLLSGGENQVFAAVGEGRRGPGEIRGIVTSVGRRQITVNTGGDRPREANYTLAPDVNVVIDEKPATVADLAAGMIVRMQRLEGESSVIGIRADGPTIGGDVKSADSQTRRITLVGRRTEEGVSPDATYAVGIDAKVIIDGKPAVLADIRPGAKVALKLSVDQKTVVQVTQGMGGGEGRRRESRREE